MIDWFRTWAKEIIIVVIVITLIEIVLPSNNTKKYVKIVSGLIIMYTVMYPIFGKLFDNNNSDILLVSSQPKTIKNLSIEYDDINNSSSNTISSIYTNNLKKDISSRLLNIGYECGEISVLVDKESYALKEIQIEIKSKISNKKKAYSIVKTIERVCVSISNNEEKENCVIDEDSRAEIISLISETYGIDQENIDVK